MPLIPSSTTPTLPRADIQGTIEAGKSLFTPLTPRILRPFPVMSNKGVAGVAPIKTVMRRGSAAARAPGTAYPRHVTKLEDVSFSCLEYGNEEPIDDSQAKLYASFFDYETFSFTRLMRMTLLEQEIRTKTLIHNETTFPATATTGLTVSNPWSTAASGTPIADAAAGKKALHAKTGLSKFGLQISWNAVMDISNCAEVLDRTKYTQRPSASLPLETIASILEVDEVVAPDRIMYDAGLEGAAASLTEVWSKTYAFLYVIPETDAIEEPCLGRTFTYDADGGMMITENYREDKVRASIQRARQYVQEKLIFTDCGFLLKSVG